jgi:simple sugar transport system ATP-binding protein
VESHNSPILQARGLTKRYGSVQALRGADFELRHGEVMAVVGDNGAGKSTFVNVLSGAIQPDSGEILFEGKPVHFSNPRDAADVGIGTVYQDLALAPDLDPTANLYLGHELVRPGLLGRMGFLDKRAMRDGAAQAFRDLDPNVVRDGVAISGLSGGQRQSVAVTRAVFGHKRVVFMDEPTAALGVVQSANVRELIRRVKQSGVSVVLISHNLPEVFDVSDRIQVLRLGQRVATFNTKETTMEAVVGAMTGAMSADQIGTAS